MMKRKMGRIYKAFCAVLYVASMVALGVYFGPKIKGSVQINLIDSLLNISAFIFAIAGAWLAIIYPEAIRTIFKWNANPDHNYEKVKKLVFPISTSTISVCLCLSIKYVSVLIPSLNLSPNSLDILKSISFTIISILTSLQIAALLATFAPMAILEKEVGKNAGMQKSVNRMRGEAKTYTDDSPSDH